MHLSYASRLEVTHCRDHSGSTQNSLPHGVTHDPEVEAAFLLVIPAGSAECFEALHLGFDIDAR